MNLTGQAEREYFIRKLGGTNTGKTTNQIKREYYIKILGVRSADYPFNQLESEWQNKMIAAGSATPMSFNRGKLNFYLNAS